MLPAEEFPCGHGAARRAMPMAECRWLRPLAQWLAVGAAHALALSAVLHLSPQARQVLDEVIQASLIAPTPRPVAPPPAPEPPRPPRKTPPPKPAPLLAAPPRSEAPAAAFEVPLPPDEPVPAAPAPPAPAAAPVAAPLPPIVPPVFNADYLENPPPVYPSMSRHRGETGQVLLRVFVSAAGRAERVEIKTSSGFERLDQAAREAVARWRFVPARRGDEEIAAWVLVPIAFVMR